MEVDRALVLALSSTSPARPAPAGAWDDRLRRGAWARTRAVHPAGSRDHPAVLDGGDGSRRRAHTGTAVRLVPRDGGATDGLTAPDHVSMRQEAMRLRSGVNPCETPQRTAWVRLATSILR